MKWSSYYEKSMFDWPVSTMVNQIPFLEDMGRKEEVTEILCEIGKEDKEGASRLMEKALKYGVKFSAENFAEIGDLCGEASFRKALEQAAPGFTAGDLETMEGFVADELLIELIRKYGVPAPKDFMDEHEEQICSDPATPISWRRFYDRYQEWSPAYAKKRSGALTGFGNEDQVMEVISELFFENTRETCDFVERALAAGVKFGVDNLLEISAMCDEKTTLKAFVASLNKLRKEDFETLRDGIDDYVIIEVAKKHHRSLPESLRSVDPEVLAAEELKFNIEMTVESADYALQCLYRAQEMMNAGSYASLADLFSRSPWISVFKHLTLGEAQQELQIACNALNVLNSNLKCILQYRNVQLSYVRLTSLISLWFDDDFMNCLIHMRIGKVQKKIRRAISQVESIRRELAVLWEKL